MESFKVADLCNAAADGNLEHVKAILAVSPHLVGVDMAESNERRALHYAVESRKPEIVLALMAAGADPHQGVYPHRDATTGLVMARDRGYTEIVEIIEGEEEKRLASLRCPNLSVTDEIRSFGAAVAEGEEAVAMKMLSDNPSLVGACDDEGNTGLHLSALHGRYRIVSALIALGASLEKENTSGRTPLDEAVGFEHDASAALTRNRMICAGALIQAGARPSLSNAIMIGDTAMVRRRAADEPELFKPNVAEDRKYLRDAVQHRQNEMVALLLELGVDPDERFRIASLEEETYNWGAPLWIAADTGQFEVAEQLLKAGADANASVYASGWPLSRAFFRNDEAMKRLLYRYGAYLPVDQTAILGDVSGTIQVVSLDPQKYAMDALWSAVCGGYPDILGFVLRHIDLDGDDPRWFGVLVESMRYWGADQRPASDRGNWLEVLKMLLDHGVDPNVLSRPEQNLTMLHTVVSRNGQITESERVAHATMLLEYGADLEAIDRNLQSTPLGWAARWGKKDLVTLYLDHHADPNLSGEPWGKPLVWAEKYGHGEISTLLRSRGGTGFAD